jgi:hypothetical protein
VGGDRRKHPGLLRKLLGGDSFQAPRPFSDRVPLGLQGTPGAEGEPTLRLGAAGALISAGLQEPLMACQLASGRWRALGVLIGLMACVALGNSACDITQGS